MRVTSVLAILLLSISLTHAHPQRDKNECKMVKQKIRNIQSKMRAGYTRAAGERMEKQLRKLRATRAKKCR